MKLWAGRFQKETDTLVNAFNSSITFDARLYQEVGNPGKINDLILLAEKLPTMMKDTILTRLKELL